MATPNQMNFTVFREGEEVEEISIIGPATLTAGELKALSESFRSRGYEVRVNGTLASDASVSSICESLRTQGIAVYVDGALATDGTQIRSGSVVTGVGEVKGA